MGARVAEGMFGLLTIVTALILGEHIGPPRNQSKYRDTVDNQLEEE